MSRISILFISIILFCISCKKETGVAGPMGTEGRNGLDGNLLDTGTLSGNLAVYDEFSWPLKDSIGVTVSLELNGAPRTTTSDASGNYYFHGLPVGTYNLTYQKSNFGSMKVFGISHAPGSGLNTVVPETYVIQNPVKTAVDSIKIDSFYSYVLLHIYLDTSSLTYSQYPYNFAVLLGKNPKPDPSNTDLLPLDENILPDGTGAYTLFIDRSNLGGTNPGSPYYINVGTYNRYLRATKNQYSTFEVGAGGYYADPADGKFVFPNLKLAPHPIMVH